MNAPICIDSNSMEWKDCQPGKFVKTSLKILYDKESDMPERVYYARIRPGGSVEMHTHPNTEVFFVISGQGEVLAGDQKFHDITGKVFFVQPGVEHCLRNTGDEDVMLISFAVHPVSASKKESEKETTDDQVLSEDKIEWLCATLKQIAGVEKEMVKPENKLKDLGVDSLTAVELMALLNQRFDVGIKLDEIRKWKTIGDIQHRWLRKCA